MDEVEGGTIYYQINQEFGVVYAIGE